MNTEGERPVKGSTEGSIRSPVRGCTEDIIYSPVQVSRFASVPRKLTEHSGSNSFLGLEMSA